MRIAVIAQTTGRATEAEQRHLELDASQLVLRVMRLTFRDDRPSLYEQISMPLTRFPELDTDAPITSSLADIAQRHGLELSEATEQLRLVPAPRLVARQLRIAPRSRLLRLSRVVRTPDGRPVEWRVVFATLDR